MSKPKFLSAPRGEKKTKTLSGGTKTHRRMNETTETKERINRLLGFRHRVKTRIVDNEPTEPLPSQIVIVNRDSEIQRFDLPNEQAELDFINGSMPVKYRTVNLTEDISGFKPWQIKWRASKDEDTLTPRHDSQCRYHERRVKRGETPIRELVEVATDVPTHFVGLETGDDLAMCLGGSGGYFAFASARKLHSMGGELYQIPPFKLKAHRGGAPKDHDAELLAKILKSHKGDFYPTMMRDLSIIRVRETFKLRMDAMKDRMACVQRLRQRHIGVTFCTVEGGFPEGNLEKEFGAIKASDPILQAVEHTEALAHKSMAEAVEATDVYQRLFADIAGVGPAISARIISAIIDVRRFETSAKLKKFLGVHVNPDGTFPRRRGGEVASWHPDGRQALYLLADQFVKRPASPWGIKLNEYKVKFRAAHPYVCIALKNGEVDAMGKAKIELVPLVPGKYKQDKKTRRCQILGDDGTTVVREIVGPMRYNNGHIHKMAIWRTITKFVEWLHQEWWKLEADSKVAVMPQSREATEGGEQKIA